MKLTLLDLLVYGLASFRVAVLLSEDGGPARVFSRLRSWLKREAKRNAAVRKSDLHHGVECLRCTSVWVALPVGAYAVASERIAWIDALLVGLALSACAILWNRAFPKRQA